MKKLITGICAAVFCTAVFAIDLSFGGGMDYTHTLGVQKVDSDKIKESRNLLGVKAFFDAQYAMISLGADFTVGKTALTWGTSGQKASPFYADINAAFIQLSLLGKYPFDLGIAKLYPMAGFDFNFALSAKADNKPLSSEAKKDLNAYYFSFGAGSDIYVMQNLFIRPTVLFGIRMNKTSQYKEMKKISSLKVSEMGYKFNAGLSIGYML